jgi:hypothetical protein
MSDSEHNNTLFVQFTSFPQNLLIPPLENVISFQATNYYNSQENYKVEIESENLTIVSPEIFEKEILFQPREAKNFEIKLVPTADGYGKISIKISWLKKIEFKVKVKKVRTVISKSKIKDILKKYIISFSKDTDDFRVESYFISTSTKALKNAEKQVEEMKNKYDQYQVSKKEYEAKKKQGIVETEPKLEFKVEDLENKIVEIAKGYLSNQNPQKAIELILRISNENKKNNLRNDIIRAYASKDIDTAIELIKSLPNTDIRTNLVKKIALDQAKINPETAPRIAFLIENSTLRQDLIVQVIGKVMYSHQDVAVKICQLIEDEVIRIKILFNIFKLLHDNKDNAHAVEVVKNIISIIEKSSKLNLSENKYKNEVYNSYKDSINLLAEIDSPKSADLVLTSFSLREVKDKISDDLFNLIYEMVDELRIKFEATLIFHQQYVMNTYCSSITEEMKNFCNSGGNISNNILIRDFNFNLLLFSFFGYDFSIVPIIDNLYNDLKFNNNKSIAYYIYPLKIYHNDNEFKITSNLIKLLHLAENLKMNRNPILILNLDFIPYIGKPTIILPSEPKSNQMLVSKINKTLGNKVDIKTNNSLFEGGKIKEFLNQLFSTNNDNIVNLVLSYEFLNNYELFKDFILSLI